LRENSGGGGSSLESRYQLDFEEIGLIGRGGEIAVAELLRKRVRYFHDGAAIGCRGFLEEVFRNNRKNFGPKRKQGARKMRGGNWGELMAMRDLRGG
jgi:hypothetical protein